MKPVRVMVGVLLLAVAGFGAPVQATQPTTGVLSLLENEEFDIDGGTVVSWRRLRDEIAVSTLSEGLWTTVRIPGDRNFGISGDVIVTGHWVDDADGARTILLVYERNATGWVEVARFEPPVGRTYSRVAIHDDRIAAIVRSTLEKDDVHVIERTADGWSVVDTIPAPEAVVDPRVATGLTADGYGTEIDVFGDVIAVGAPRADLYDPILGGHYGAVYVFERNGGVWEHTVRLPGATPSGFGIDLALEDTLLVAGASGFGNGRGEVVVFELDRGAWTEVQRIRGDNRRAAIGSALDLSGPTLIIGAPGFSSSTRGKAQVYEFDPIAREFVPTHTLEPEIDFWAGRGRWVATGGDLHIMSGPQTGPRDHVFMVDPGAAFCLGRTGTRVGGDGDDVLVGTRGDDVVIGGGGADRIVTGRGDDIVCAGDGDDEILTGGGSDIVLAGDGDDTVAASAGGDQIDGGPGDDMISGGSGPDVIDGGPDDDVLEGDRSNDTISGGDGTDRIFGGPGSDVIDGGGGNDEIVGGGRRNQVTGGAGNDLIVGGTLADRLFGDDGNDRLEGRGGSDLIEGGAGDDLILGGADDDRLLGEDGNDTLRGGTGQDTAIGGAGDDLIDGSNGGDSLSGGPGVDDLRGGDGADYLNGGPGDDRITGDEGVDEGLGGGGTDECWWVEIFDSCEVLLP